MSTIRTEAFDQAYKFVTETNANIFLTGKAGTGKTTFLKYLKDNSPKNMAVAAPTGVAAINAGGVTLHSLFQLPFGPFIPANKQTLIGFDKKKLLTHMRFSSVKLELLRSLELLVIDEASMVASHTVDAIDTILRFVRHNREPFGGIQVLFIGDLYQLQPVVKKDEWQILKEYYSSIFFFDSLVLKQSIPVMIELKEIFRQKDEHFIGILNGIRDNKLTAENISELSKRMKPNFISIEGDGYITLTTHNHQANKINEIKLNRLVSKQYKFVATTGGEFPENMYPADKELFLKKDAQVMFIKNDLEDKLFYNGKIGVITEISDEKIIVEADGIKIDVGKYEWKNITYSIDPDSKELKENIIGTFSQYPLRLAWAITIHKSQGLTFEKVVIDAENAFVNGQVYVALSRATSLEGLILTGPVNDQFLGAHAELQQWQENNYREDSLPALFENAKKTYIKQVLFNAFSFDQLRISISSIKKELEENLVEATSWLNEISAKQNSINNTALKFKNTLEIMWRENADASENEKMNLRIKEAAVYFSDQLAELKIMLYTHSIKISTRKISRKVDGLLETLCESLLHSITKIKICKKGFQINELLAWKKSILPNDVIKSTYHSSKQQKSESNSDLYELLSDYRNEVATENGVPPFMIYSNNAIKNCCELLPANKESLIAVSGFGKNKVRDYGDEVLKIIRQYSEENNISLNDISEAEIKDLEFKKSFNVSPTVMETINLFISGKNISEICDIRKLASSTIEGHFAVGIKNKLVDIKKILDKQEIEIIATYFSDDAVELKLARAKSGDEVSYGKLKMVQAWLISEKIESFS